MNNTSLPCTCIELVNLKLVETNTRIRLPMHGPQLPFVVTEKLDPVRRGSPVSVFCTYCPFCGAKAVLTLQSRQDILEVNVNDNLTSGDESA
jgi:hypothetical protein